MLKYILGFAGGLAALTSSCRALAVDYKPEIKKNVDPTTPDIAAITSVSTSMFKSYPASVLPRSHTDTAARWACNSEAVLTHGDNPSSDGPGGIFITNADVEPRGFYFYHNMCDHVPYKYIWVGGHGETRFVALPPLFQGRVTRGLDVWNLQGSPQLLATWFEISFDSAGWVWGDVSLIRGCDGGALFWATDGSSAWKGFDRPALLEGAPPAAYAPKDSGVLVLDESTNWDGTINTVVRDWEYQLLGANDVYVDDLHGNPVITSTNGRFGTYWPAGRP